MGVPSSAYTSHLLIQMLAPAYQLLARDQIAPGYQLSALDHSTVTVTMIGSGSLRLGELEGVI